MTLVRTFLCPHCGEALDTCVHYNGEDIDPGPGAVGVCVACTLPHVFNADMTARKFDTDRDIDDRTPEELATMLMMMYQARDQRVMDKLGIELPPKARRSRKRTH